MRLPLPLALALIRLGTPGTLTSTGTGGIDLEPIVSKGAADVEVLDVDTNDVMGISSGRTIGTDFHDPRYATRGATDRRRVRPRSVAH